MSNFLQYYTATISRLLAIAHLELTFKTKDFSTQTYSQLTDTVGLVSSYRRLSTEYNDVALQTRSLGLRSRLISSGSSLISRIPTCSGKSRVSQSDCGVLFVYLDRSVFFLLQNQFLILEGFVKCLFWQLIHFPYFLTLDYICCL